MMITPAKGKIILSSVSNAKKNNADEYWLITRGGQSIAGFRRVVDLAPVPALFRKYLAEWRGKPGEIWWPQYSERFNDQLTTHKARRFLAELEALTDGGASIVLACYCRDEYHCHRRLVGDYLASRGIEVVSSSGAMVDRGRNESYASALPVVAEQLSLFAGD